MLEITTMKNAIRDHRALPVYFLSDGTQVLCVNRSGVVVSFGTRMSYDT